MYILEIVKTKKKSTYRFSFFFWELVGNVKREAAPESGWSLFHFS